MAHIISHLKKKIKLSLSPLHSLLDGVAVGRVANGSNLLDPSPADQIWPTIGKSDRSWPDLAADHFFF